MGFARLSQNHKPVYGLIFLFHWREDNPVNQEASCPDGLWFANQTTSNACASVALLNIINNVEGIHLGEHLANFKDFTMPFTPALRGDAVANFEFVKRIHNSFARSMDIFNSDLQLKYEATRKTPKSQKEDDNSSSEAGFHFIAFVPAMGRVWKFDGLERQPQDLAPCSDDDWLDEVRDHLINRIMEYEEGNIAFSVLGLVRDPLQDHIERLALNVKLLQFLHHHVPEHSNRMRERLSGFVLLEAKAEFGLTEKILDLVGDQTSETDRYKECSSDELFDEYSRLVNEQQSIIRSINEEVHSRQMDDAYAEGRRHDYSSAVEFWARTLIRKGALADLIDS
ncbi:ubiquitin carboxyl-terminal hydrolase L5 [Talaromyces islandicus]|uniref:ubiquitinyl hydrolase 1 n=1 Tax=Talaromyces islandicus TaxID=28573 RepID=A0A0U1LJX8_TALIS|nr:ubiquitin carboxyl-terminal hydrolase L5 [Talaromyces islandicus]